VELAVTKIGTIGLHQTSSWQHQGGRLYNISNFGDTNTCYADVDEGEELVFFLTVFNDRLSAKYDDLFGAVAERTSDNEDEILRALGQSNPGQNAFRTVSRLVQNIVNMCVLLLHTMLFKTGRQQNTNRNISTIKHVK